MTLARIPDEIQELRSAVILFLRGTALAALTGFLWSLSAIHGAFWVLALLGVFPGIFALSVTAIAATVARNSICRQLRLLHLRRLCLCLGVVVTVLFLTANLGVFLISETVARSIWM